jgi:hypothetical protein
VPAGPYVQLLYRVSWVGCGLGLTATCYFLAGLSGHFNNPLLNALAVAAMVLAALFFLVALARALNDTNRLGRLVWVLIVAVILVQIVLSLVPPTTRDELTHHLLMPRLYIERGRIFDLPFAPNSYYPMLLDMLYTPWLRWGWDSAPKLVHGLFGFLTALLLYAYLAHRLSPLYGLLGFFFYISLPAVLRLSNVAFVDLGLVFYSTTSLLCLICWLDEISAHRWLILAGLSAGFAMATKPNGLLVFLLLFLFLAFALGKRKDRSLPWILSGLFLFGVLALIAFSPWAIKNLVRTGNPLFPFFSGQDDQPLFFDGVLSPLLILFLPWAFKGKWAEEKRLFFDFAAFYLLYALFLGDFRVRYILPIVPPLVILSVYGIHNIYLRIIHPFFLFAALILLTALNGVYLWDYFQTVSPLDYLRGRLTQKQTSERRQN